jgi:kynurenine 3-monooxygenase
LNKILLDELESLPNVKFFFNHKLTGADFRKHKAWFEISDQKTPSRGRHREIEIEFDFLIGADGAHSSTRYHLMKYARMDYQQEYIDTLWCEFQIMAQPFKAGEDEKSKFVISPHHLHIWPGKEFMFIAIPSLVPPLSSPTTKQLTKPGRFLHMHALPPFFLLHHSRKRPLLPPLILQHPFPRRHIPDPFTRSHHLLHKQSSPPINKHKMRSLPFPLFSRNNRRRCSRHGSFLRTRHECGS